jgi:hypothetical protein
VRPTFTFDKFALLIATTVVCGPHVKIVFNLSHPLLSRGRARRHRCCSRVNPPAVAAARLPPAAPARRPHRQRQARAR